MKICTEIIRFSERMQFKLDKNKHKDCPIMNPGNNGKDWYQCDYKWLLMRLKEEIEELEEAMDLLDIESTPKTMGEAVNECADVANFAMMISDKLTTMY